MCLRYRSFSLFPLALLLGAAAAGALAALAAPAPWTVSVLLPLPAAAGGLLLWVAQLDEASRLGALEVDGAGLRRIRGDGRVLHVARWDEIRAVLVDPSRREALVMVPGGGGFPVRGAPLLGGVGLEHFQAFVEMLPDFTGAPIRLPEHPARRPGGSTPPPSAARG
jgi:hypothetical protein